MGYCPFMVLYHGRESSVATGSPGRDRVPRPRTRHYPSKRSGRAHAAGYAREIDHGPCRDMAVCVATRPA